MGTGESQFRKWITATAPNAWLVQPIETSTGTGIPDLFICAHAWSFWVELKSTNAKNCYMRISQWRWFNKLNSRGGIGLLFIKRVKEKRIDVYKTDEITALDVQKECELKGNDISFPASIKPAFSYKLGTGNGTFYENVIQLLEESYG